MWVRKRIEISPADLTKGFWYCLTPGDREVISRNIADVWQAPDCLVCLSVRSGFDLLMQSAEWEAGSEVIMSGLTIPDMPRIVEAHGLKAVGVDIDLNTMQPDIARVRQAISPRTRAIVVAHLLGGICDMGPVLEVAREHNLLVIEDCAQAYTGSSYQGDERADVSMFSFGPIKTNTSLAGAVLRVRQPRLHEAMVKNHGDWQIQSRARFARRIAKYGFVKVISTRPLCGGFYRFMRLFGKNHDGVASSMARGFAGPGFFEKIRQQPSLPLLKLMHHKLAAFDPSTTDRRQRLGNRFGRLVSPETYLLGGSMLRQTWWVLPVLVEQPDQLVRHLWDSGFDASNSCSLLAITESEDSVASQILRHIVFLPLHSQMPVSEVERMAGIVRETAPQRPAFLSRCRPVPQESTETAQGVVADPHFSRPATLVGQSSRF
jgi:dTDP-4-amino-4,6-dideoxygalactose transaminase